MNVLFLLIDPVKEDILYHQTTFIPTIVINNNVICPTDSMTKNVFMTI